MYPLIKNTMIKDLIELSSKLFGTKACYPLSKDYVASSKPHKTILYPLNQLKTMPLGDDKRSTKYIVKPDKRMLLARTNEPERGHADMSSTEVLAAGYLFLNDQKEIISISNEGPGFEQQSIESLLWPLLILHVKRAFIAETFSIIDCISQREYTLNSKDRIEIASSLTVPQRKNIEQANSSDGILVRENGIESQAQTFFTGLKAPEKTRECLQKSTLPSM